MTVGGITEGPATRSNKELERDDRAYQRSSRAETG